MPHPRRRRALVLALLALPAVVLFALPVWTLNIALLRDPPRSWAATTTGSWASMIYVARTDSGVVAVDLGWVGAERALRGALREIDATPNDVVAVFLTHSHRDHIAAWPLVRHARFYLGAAELPRLVGGAEHRGALTRAAEAVRRTRRPADGELDLRPFAHDTAIAFGRDTVWGYLVPGHTAGSAAYVVRGVLFAGDAATKRPLTSFRGAHPGYSDDVGASRESMRSLFARLAREGARVVTLCTAHGKCGALDDEMRRRVVESRVRGWLPL
ncbi:MAG TPA: MBL fold metallo-hydrolase [Gemmatimonadaceae bacterium]|nr:MBL fold metallo-hydrolase [Gemmatimonadaceae bacterium]